MSAAAELVRQHLIDPEICPRRARGRRPLARARHEKVAALLRDRNCYVCLCGLKGMEAGVDEAFAEVCRRNGLDCSEVLPALEAQARYHVETY